MDDIVSNIKTLLYILNTEYTVYAANSGRKALKAAEYYLPDVILLDILMPEIDGYEVIRTLKRSENTLNVPVIFITGLNDSESEETGLTLGASDYIIAFIGSKIPGAENAAYFSYSYLSLDA